MVYLFIEGPWCLSFSFWCITRCSEMKYLRTTQFSFYLAHDTVSQLGVFSGLAPLSSDGASQVFLPTDGVASLTDGGSSAPSAGMARLFSMWPLILQPPGLLHMVKSKSRCSISFQVCDYVTFAIVLLTKATHTAKLRVDMGGQYSRAETEITVTFVQMIHSTIPLPLWVFR